MRFDVQSVKQTVSQDLKNIIDPRVSIKRLEERPSHCKVVKFVCAESRESNASVSIEIPRVLVILEITAARGGKKRPPLLFVYWPTLNELRFSFR